MQLLPYTCHYNARFKPNILCICGISYQHNPLGPLNPNLTIRFIEFTYCNDKFSSNKVLFKTTKHLPLMNSIRILGWNVAPLVVVIAEIIVTTYIPCITQLQETFYILKTSIKNALKCVKQQPYTIPCPYYSIKEDLETINHYPFNWIIHN